MSRYSSLTQIVQNSVFDSNISAADIARCVGKPYPTMMRELNPYDPGAKLGAETMLDIMKATGDVKPLKYMADELGYKITLA